MISESPERTPGSHRFAFRPGTTASGPVIFALGTDREHAEVARVEVDGMWVAGVLYRDPFLHPAFRIWFSAASNALPRGVWPLLVVSGGGIEFNEPNGTTGLRLDRSKWTKNGKAFVDPADVYYHFRDWLVRALASLTI